ncbi:MAG: L,D-transpeptidase family protein [Chlamydiales bacterium]|nr:L,D-transpeptidase [Chlamydiales bacterium]NCF70938.1 L,D-transpeptidase family protein [Chlamydiales bacterium]
MNFSFPRIVLIIGVFLFGSIALAVIKKSKNSSSDSQNSTSKQTEQLGVSSDEKTSTDAIISTTQPAQGLPTEDRVEELFNIGMPKLPIVKTVKYSSYVSWLKGRPAWIADYASHYKTSRHFIARSLNKKSDYFTQNVVNGDYFNVLDPEKDITFHLKVDVSRCKMWFSYQEEGQAPVLLKTYDVGLGRPDPKSPSGTLTPLGRYTLGDKVAVYKPGVMGFFKDERVEMMKVFGTRWIPFGKEVAGATRPAKGFGIHGAPWTKDSKNNNWTEDLTGIGKFHGDGCIRLPSQDIEEIFSIVLTRPTEIEIVNDYFDSITDSGEIIRAKPVA